MTAGKAEDDTHTGGEKESASMRGIFK